VSGLQPSRWGGEGENGAGDRDEEGLSDIYTLPKNLSPYPFCICSTFGKWLMLLLNFGYLFKLLIFRSPFRESIILVFAQKTKPCMRFAQTQNS
jgi:hypothetical protein